MTVAGHAAGPVLQPGRLLGACVARARSLPGEPPLTLRARPPAGCPCSSCPRCLQRKAGDVLWHVLMAKQTAGIALRILAQRSAGSAPAACLAALFPSLGWCSDPPHSLLLRSMRRPPAAGHCCDSAHILRRARARPALTSQGPWRHQGRALLLPLHQADARGAPGGRAAPASGRSGGQRRAKSRGRHLCSCQVVHRREWGALQRSEGDAGRWRGALAATRCSARSRQHGDRW